MRAIVQALFAVAFLTVGAAAGFAEPPERAPDDGERAYAGAEGEIRVETVRLTTASISVDARLDEDAWSRASLLHRFTQFDPIEGVRASQETEVLVFVDDEAIYFGIRARDGDPEGIRATLTERDNVARSDDIVRIVLDTFNDQRRGYVFTVNPLGVQQDGIWLEGGTGERGGGFRDPIDYNPDFLWESAGELTSWGYQAEVRIPFKSLRFPDRDAQDWGLQVERHIQRNGYKSSWAPITADETNKLALAGQLLSLGRLDPGLFLELNPVVTGRRTGELDEETGSFGHESPSGEVGLNATYGITSNLTLDATVNPDFSQVEADAGQIAVNERFDLFFPEKRPFFLEGTEIFGLPMRLVHTRTIADPIGGAKMTGKVGGINLGYLGAVDRLPDDDDEDDPGGEAVVNLLRFRKDVGQSSTLGLLYTDRTRSSDDFNRVLGGDARFVFNRRYTLTLLGAASRTASSPDDTETGTLLNVGIDRSGRHLSFDAELQDVAPEFATRSGFIRRTGDTQVRGEVRYNFWGEQGASVERIGPNVEFQGFWDHDDFWSGGGPQEWELQYGGSVSFRKNLTFFASGILSGFDFSPDSYEGLFLAPEGAAAAPAPFRPAQERFQTLHGVRLFVWFNTWQRFRGRIRAERREAPIFERTAGAPVETADAWVVDGSFTLFPSRQLQSEIGLRHETLFRQDDGSRYSTATIPRIRTQYQFTRALFLRTIVEYDSQDRAALRDPVTGRTILDCGDGCELEDGSEDPEIYGEVLLSSEPSPGPVFFLGYSRALEDRRAFSFDRMRTRSDGVFLKGSYRFRF